MADEVDECGVVPESGLVPKGEPALTEPDALSRLHKRLSHELQAVYDERNKLMDDIELLLQSRFSATREEYERGAEAMATVAGLVQKIESRQQEIEALSEARDAQVAF